MPFKGSAGLSIQEYVSQQKELAQSPLANGLWKKAREIKWILDSHFVNKILKFPHTWLPKVSLPSSALCVHI